MGLKIYRLCYLTHLMVLLWGILKVVSLGVVIVKGYRIVHFRVVYGPVALRIEFKSIHINRLLIDDV